MTGVSLRVHVEGGALERRTFDLALGASLRVGRDFACDVVLASRAVSRKHVTLTALAVGVEVEDTSANGVLIGEHALRSEKRVLAPPFAMSVGPYVVRVEAASVPVATAEPALRRRLHRALLDRLDIPRQNPGAVDEPLRRRVLVTLAEVVREMAPHIGAGPDQERLVRELGDEVLGLGALEPLLADPNVSEIMVVDANTIFVERAGKLARTETRFSDGEALRAVIERIVTPLGRRIDESTPLVDARLPDGSRVNAVIPPLAVKGPCLTIRRFGERRMTISDLVAHGSLSEAMARFLGRCVQVRRNIVVSGGTGSGKTTLLNVLSGFIPESERIVTVEDAAELRLAQEHVVTLESRPPNVQGAGEVSIRDLVKNALRMRPDRIIVGECRGGEALDMLQAMNTGHDGSMTTTHANSPREAIARLETLALMSGLELPSRAIRAQIASSVHLVVQQSRFSDGGRRVVSIAEVGGIDDHGEIVIHEIYRFSRGRSTGGEVAGDFRPTGHVPSFVGQFLLAGLADDGECL
jgi:pilus assembly protein CpaF